MKRFCLCFLFLGLYNLTPAQISKTDSLEQILPNLTGVERAIALYELVSIYNRTDHTKLKQFIVDVKKMQNDENKVIKAYTLLSLAIDKTAAGLNDSAIYLLRRAKEYAFQAGNADVNIRISGTLGRLLIASGRGEEGLKNLFEAMKMLETNPNQEYELKVRTNISYAYLELKQYRNCIDFGNESLLLMSSPKYDYIRLFIFNNSAASYGALGMLDSAKYMADRTLVTAKASADNQSIANAYFILGNIYANAGDYQKAIEQFEQAIPYRKKVGNPFFIVSDLQVLSSLYYTTGRFREGIQVGEQALEIATSHNLLLKFENTYVVLAENYEGIGDYKKSSKYYELWAVAKDSIYKNASATAIAEMRTRYETEKKEQQIALQKLELSGQKAHLQKTYIAIAALILIAVLVVIVLRGRFIQKQLVAEQEKQLAVREAFMDATIRSQENERKRFAQDLHDGMGQLISSLRIMINQLDKNAPIEDKISIVEQSETILDDMHTEIRAIAFNLMPQTLIQHGLVPALREMALRINQTKKITVEINAYDIPERMSEVWEISLYRIIQEWINNVMKYAQATKIEVQLVGHEGEINITVEDDGAGFDKAQLELSQGNGWKNINSRANLIKAELEVDSHPSRKGTTLLLTLPVAPEVQNPAQIPSGTDRS